MTAATDKPRPRKKPQALIHGDEDAPSKLTAHCPDCGTATPMLKPVRRVSNGIAITVGKCSTCKRETFRVGAVREGDVGDIA